MKNARLGEYTDTLCARARVSTMISAEQARKIEPALESLTDEQILGILNDMYGLSQLAFEKWATEKSGSKHPTRVLSVSS